MSKKQPKKSFYIAAYVDDGAVVPYYNCDDQVSVFDNLDEAKQYLESELYDDETGFGIYELVLTASFHTTPRKVTWRAAGKS